MDEKTRKVIIARDCTAASAKTEGHVVHRGWEGELSEEDALTLVGIGKAHFLDGKNAKGVEVADPGRDREIAAIRKTASHAPAGETASKEKAAAKK